MDIEFAEYESMDGLSEAFPASEGQELPIGQFMVEIHLFKGQIDAAKYLEWYEIFLCHLLLPPTIPSLKSDPVTGGSALRPGVCVLHGLSRTCWP